MNKIHLRDSFNDLPISSHRTLLAAIKKQRQHAAAVRRRNGKDSYLWYEFRNSDGTPVDGDEIMDIKMALDQA